MTDESVQLCVDEKEQNNSSETLEEETKHYVKPSTKLSDGILSLYQGSLDEVQSNVKEVLRNQNVLRDMAQNELTQLKENIMLADMVKTFDDAKLYHKKLVNMKKEMNGLSNRMEKIKMRAQKLQEKKQKELLEAAQQKERQRKYEKELTAKPAARYTQGSSK